MPNVIMGDGVIGSSFSNTISLRCERSSLCSSFYQFCLAKHLNFVVTSKVARANNDGGHDMNYQISTSE